MPALKKKEEDIKSTALTANVEARQKKLGYSNERMAKSLGINPQVYRRKVLHPELFTYLELVKVFMLLKFTQEEILESI